MEAGIRCLEAPPETLGPHSIAGSDARGRAADASQPPGATPHEGFGPTKVLSETTGLESILFKDEGHGV